MASEERVRCRRPRRRFRPRKSQSVLLWTLTRTAGSSGCGSLSSLLSLRNSMCTVMVNDKLNEILRLLRQGLGATVPAAAVTPAVAPAITRSESSHQPQIFIGSSAEGLPVAESIQLGLNEAAECTVWNQSAFDPSRTTLE